MDGIRCDRARILASADVDGELPADDRIGLDAHLATCPSCRTWVERAHRLRRSTLVRPVVAEVDLTDAVLARANVPVTGSIGWLRALLAYLGLALLVLNVPLLVTGHAAGATEHVGRHLGASGVALAVGFLYVVVRPERAIGLVPLVAALAAGLSISAVADVADGGAGLAAEATHLLELTGLVCVWVISGGQRRLVARVRGARAGLPGLRSV
ncbi:MAG: zf-HC2 domain-containing protein [Actinomycetota bacterium]